MEPSLKARLAGLSLPWRKPAAPGGKVVGATLRWLKPLVALLLAASAAPTLAEPWERRPVPVPSLSEVSRAYRRHVEANNAEIIEELGAKKARQYLVRIVELEAVRCEFHSGRSHLCRIIVSIEVNGRVGPRRAGDALMTPDEDEREGWKLRMLRRPR
ncbi:hypothetical protein ACS5PK_17960 [Roseateles sp. DB2]|uniref:hypothetical protein n=1 Tax=Roseateles sp. DB2 TaxID=3453717 RepID=UPI003EED452B